jgi:hypothetical protein
LHHDNALFHTSFFTRESFIKKQNDCRPLPPYFSPFPRLKIKLKDRHSCTNELIEEKSQTVLNILTEHDFQDAFKTAEALGTVHRRGRELLQGNGSQKAQS